MAGSYPRNALPTEWEAGNNNTPSTASRPLSASFAFDGGAVTTGVSTGRNAIESSGNYVYAPGKMVALLGVDDLVVVETPDALLITTRDRSQDVSKVVRALHDSERHELI